MPNWCENKLEVSINVSGKKNIEDAKKQLKNFKKCFNNFKNVHEEQFDVNKVIPMPESLNIPCGTSTDNAIDILEYEMGNKSKIKEMLEWSWVKEHEEIMISIFNYNNECKFVGTPQELINKYEE